MARNSDVLALASAALNNERDRVLAACRVIAANDKGSLRASLERLLQRSNQNTSQSIVPQSIKKLVLGIEPQHSLNDVVLDDKSKSIVSGFLAEHEHLEALEQYGLPVANRVLLSGPPGNGKTALAGAIAKTLDLPLLMADFSNLIQSGFGDTGNNVARLFRGAGEIPCVLFIDEMETVLSERSGVGSKDIGEVARIVSGLLLEMDHLPSQVILIGATNHLEMLDRAVVRRFDVHAELNNPSEKMHLQWIQRFAEKHPDIPVESLQVDREGLSMSDLERAYVTASKRWVVCQRQHLSAKPPECA